MRYTVARLMALPFCLQGHVQLVRVEVVDLAEDLLHQLEALPRQFQLTRSQKGFEALLFFWTFDLRFAHGVLGGKSIRSTRQIVFYR